MSAIIIFFSTGLLFYWISRMRILWHGSKDEINAVLWDDLLRGRRFLLVLRSVFMPPNELAG
jgi:hypothetical protein